MNFNPSYFNREYAQSLGFKNVVVNHMLVMNVVFGLSVEDLSERAIAHLGYEKMKWHETVYPGDTITSESLVLSKRDTSRPIAASSSSAPPVTTNAAKRCSNTSARS